MNAPLSAVVPVKLLADSKWRLAPVLTHAEREALTCAMLEDVVGALTRVRALAGVFVITSDSKAAAIASAAGATVIPDVENAGINGAVRQAAHHLAQASCPGILVIPADVPLITPRDVEAILAAHRSMPSVTLVGAAADGGTNALACCPPDAIEFCFGEDSFNKHCAAARARGIDAQIMELPNIARDIDRPEDLASLLVRASGTKTGALLAASRIAERSITESVDA